MVAVVGVVGENMKTATSPIPNKSGTKHINGMISKDMGVRCASIEGKLGILKTW